MNCFKFFNLSFFHRFASIAHPFIFFPCRLLFSIPQPLLLHSHFSVSLLYFQFFFFPIFYIFLLRFMLLCLFAKHRSVWHKATGVLARKRKRSINNKRILESYNSTQFYMCMLDMIICLPRKTKLKF